MICLTIAFKFDVDRSIHTREVYPFVCFCCYFGWEKCAQQNQCKFRNNYLGNVTFDPAAA